MPTPTLYVDAASPTPVFRQIAAQLRIAIAERSLSAGTPLPSMRRLASTLDVHFNTVAKAYQLLEAEGWAEVRHGAGAVVTHRDGGATECDARRALRQRVEAAVAEARAAELPASEIAATLEEQARALQSPALARAMGAY